MSTAAVLAGPTRTATQLLRPAGQPLPFVAALGERARRAVGLAVACSWVRSVVTSIPPLTPGPLYGHCLAALVTDRVRDDDDRPSGAPTPASPSPALEACRPERVDGRRSATPAKPEPRQAVPPLGTPQPRPDRPCSLPTAETQVELSMLERCAGSPPARPESVAVHGSVLPPPPVRRIGAPRDLCSQEPAGWDRRVRNRLAAAATESRGASVIDPAQVDLAGPQAPWALLSTATRAAAGRLPVAPATEVLRVARTAELPSRPTASTAMPSPLDWERVLPPSRRILPSVRRPRSRSATLSDSTTHLGTAPLEAPSPPRLVVQRRASEPVTAPATGTMGRRQPDTERTDEALGSAIDLVDLERMMARVLATEARRHGIGAAQ